MPESPVPPAAPEVLVAPVDELAEALAAELAREAGRALAAGGRFTIALAGGSVATALFPRLARAALDWDRFDFYWADERAVPPTSPESNYGVARRLWLDPAGVPASSVHRMPADDPDPERAAEVYSRALFAAAGRPPRLDLAILGVGLDGHVASLFPGHPLLREEARAVAFLDDSPKPPAGRMTLTLPTLAGARRLVIAAFGAEKAPVIAEALHDPDSALPVARVIRRAGRVLLLLDRAP